MRLTANAVSPSGYPIKYKWTTTRHVSSAKVRCDVEPRWFEARLSQGITRHHNRQRWRVRRSSSVSVLVNPCPVRPVCPAIEISCPTNVGIDQPLTFSSRYTGGTGERHPVYNWTVSAGTIIEGQGTDTIKVDTTGLGGSNVARRFRWVVTTSSARRIARHDPATEADEPEV